ncbi:MAG: hypothetical protein Nk1A_8180 [Endomicrobiia bacterium]|nr:MAG: hypothetical protein Nk1A_8180 [Endomicrobiia bacterium]
MNELRKLDDVQKLRGFLTLISDPDSIPPGPVAEAIDQLSIVLEVDVLARINKEIEEAKKLI